VQPQNVEVGEPEEAPVDKKYEDAIEKEEAEVDENAGRKVFDVDLNANAGGNVADHGLGHSIDADGLVGKSVLKQADSRSREAAGDRVAPRNREKDSNDQGEIEDRKAGKRPGKERLQQNRRQRHQERNGRGEAMLFELSAGCVAACGHEDSCQFPVVSCSLSVGAGLNPVGPPVYEAWQGLVAWGIAWKWRVADL